MKTLFLQSMDALQKQRTRDNLCNEAFQTILPSDFVSGYDNSLLEMNIINTWKELLKDESEWIEYFIYELDFGKDYKKGCVTFEGKNVKLKTFEDLWNILDRV